MPALPCIELDHNDQLHLIALVWQVLSSAVTEHQFVPPEPPPLKRLLAPGASFVTLYVDDQLKGSAGICEAESPLWLDVCKHAYSCAQDRRFGPLEKAQLPDVRFCISHLSALTPIDNQSEQTLLDDLMVDVDGLLITEDLRRAVFLPSVWDTFTTSTEFVAALKQKGDWPADYWSQNIKLFRFHTLDYFS